MSNDRRAAILQAIVKQYIETSQPVSSAHVIEASNLAASSATVRSEMAALENEGYLKQPHTSSGRIPTDAGYRFFVDHLSGPTLLAPAQQHDVGDFFSSASGALEQMLREAGRLLSNLTGAAAVVVAPAIESSSVRSVQLVTLGDDEAVAVVVFSDGTVEKRMIAIPQGFNDENAAQVSTLLSQEFAGKSLKSESFPQTDNPIIDNVISTTLAAFKKNTNKDSDTVYVKGAAKVAEQFEAVETVRSVLTILEQQLVVVTLIRELLDRGTYVSIGTENNLKSLADCSLVVAPTIVGGEQRGSVAVLGPTRMDYGQAMAAVAVVSRNLGDKLSNKNS